MENIKELHIILPFPKFTANNRNMFARGRVFNSPKYKAYQQECYYITRGVAGNPFIGKVSTTIDIYPPDYRRRDDDNYVKPIKDVITYCGLWMDDCQSKKTISEMHDKCDNPRIEVKISVCK